MTQTTAPSTDPLAPHGGAFLLSGNEALARAALTSRVGFASSYPGSPITEAQEMMIEASRRHPGLHAEFSTNEHVALHAATGASWSGVRTLVSMKQVGLHVASDPAAYLAYAGVRGGLVLAIGTDPGAISSTGEFDVRWFVRSMHWPLLEPSTVEEVYAFACRAFDLSEQSGLPVLFHMPSSLCHQLAVVTCRPLDPGLAVGRFEPDPESFVNVGARAVKNHARLLERLRAVRAQSGSWHQASPGGGKRGLVAAGVHFPLALEVLRKLGAVDVPVLKLGMSYPLHEDTFRTFAEGLDEVLVVEDLDGFLSQGLQALSNQLGLKTRVRSSNGEDGLGSGVLTHARGLQAIAEFLGIMAPAPAGFQGAAGPAISLPVLPDRPGTFCPGCAHRSPLLAIREVLGATGVYGGDIGCSSLPPHASDWLTCMGSGIGISQGVARCCPDQKVIASIGDSTFFHSGLPAILNASQQGLDMVLVVLDNQYVAMTGHQPTPSTLADLGGSPTGLVSIRGALHGLGVRDVVTVDAYDLGTVRETLREAMARPGLSVVIVTGECRLQFARREQDTIARQPRYAIIPELCQRCGNCYEKLGCAAILDIDEELEIDQSACTRCGLCYQVCHERAIVPFRLSEDPK